jgi:predicted nucleic acid-binding Zn ribbon protein
MRVAEEPVRIIRDRSEFGKLRWGTVSVAPHTNPAWTPFFQQAAAVVPTFDNIAPAIGRRPAERRRTPASPAPLARRDTLLGDHAADTVTAQVSTEGTPS